MSTLDSEVPGSDGVAPVCQPSRPEDPGVLEMTLCRFGDLPVLFVVGLYSLSDVVPFPTDTFSSGPPGQVSSDNQ